jgi:hypothetical protein
MLACREPSVEVRAECACEIDIAKRSLVLLRAQTRTRCPQLRKIRSLFGWPVALFKPSRYGFTEISSNSSTSVDHLDSCNPRYNLI